MWRHALLTCFLGNAHIYYSRREESRVDPMEQEEDTIRRHCLYLIYRSRYSLSSSNHDVKSV